MMIPSTLVTFLAPKVIKFLLNSIVSMNAPLVEHLSGTVIDFLNEQYLNNRDNILKAVSDVVPGNQFDGIATTVVEKLIELAIKEVAKFLEREVTKLKASHAHSPVEDESIFPKLALKKLSSEEHDLAQRVADAAIDALGAKNV